MKRALILPLLLLSVVGCTPKQKATEGEAAHPRVRIDSTTQALVEQQVAFTGTIRANQQTMIAPATGGRINTIKADVGDYVKRGELLVEMDPTAYRQAEVQLAQLQTDYERMKQVYEAEGLAKQQLDAQKAQLDVTQESVDNLLVNTELRSPINGVISARYYDPGELFAMGQREGVVGILSVIDINTLKVDIEVSERYFPYVKSGMTVAIHLDLLPEREFTGRVARITPSIDPATRTFGVEITLTNKGWELRPGMFARVSLDLGEQERILIPDLALQKQSGTNERFVYVLEADSTLRRTVVEVGQQLGHQIEVLSGLSAGEEVVTAGFARLQDGIRVSEVE